MTIDSHNLEIQACKRDNKRLRALESLGFKLLYHAIYLSHILKHSDKNVIKNPVLCFFPPFFWGGGGEGCVCCTPAWIHHCVIFNFGLKFFPFVGY